MKKKEASRSLDSSIENYESLSPENKSFVDLMTKKSLDICVILGLCEKCGCKLGTCSHSKYAIN